MKTLLCFHEDTLDGDGLGVDNDICITGLFALVGAFLSTITLILIVRFFLKGIGCRSPSRSLGVI